MKKSLQAALADEVEGTPWRVYGARFSREREHIGASVDVGNPCHMHVWFAADVDRPIKRALRRGGYQSNLRWLYPREVIPEQRRLDRAIRDMTTIGSWHPRKRRRRWAATKAPFPSALLRKMRSTDWTWTWTAASRNVELPFIDARRWKVTAWCYVIDDGPRIEVGIQAWPAAHVPEHERRIVRRKLRETFGPLGFEQTRVSGARVILLEQVVPSLAGARRVRQAVDGIAE